VYLHDLARTHDGVCYRHGGDAMKKVESLPRGRELFARGGVQENDSPLIHAAVVHHSLPKCGRIDPHRLSGRRRAGAARPNSAWLKR